MNSNASYVALLVLPLVTLGIACGDDAGDDVGSESVSGNDAGSNSRTDARDARSSDEQLSLDASHDSTVDASRDGGSSVDASLDGGSSVDASLDGGSSVDASLDGGRDAEAGLDAGNLTRLPVNLGLAGNYVILAKSAIGNGPTSAITGDLGISPAAATYITGLPLTADASNLFSRTAQVTGKIFAATYAAPTPSLLTTAVGDMQTAFTDAAGRAPGVTELGAGNIGGMTLGANVYRWGTGLLIPSDLALTGNATDVWIFQVAQDLTVTNGTKIKLSGGALAKNVFWQVAGAAKFGTTSHVEGIVLSKTAIILQTNASFRGRLLAQTAVTLAANVVDAP